MTRNQTIKLNMFLTVRNCIAQNETVAKAIPKFMENFAILQNTTSEIQMIGEMQRTNKTGLARDKNKLKMTLIELAVRNSRKIAALAKFMNSETLLKEIKTNEAALSRMQEVNLLQQAQTIYDRAETNLDKLKEHGITAETQKVFIEAINALNLALKTPRAGIAEKRKATERLPVLFGTADKALELMDFGVGIVWDEQPDFVAAYKTARKLVDTNTGNIALKASAADLLNGEPLKGVIFAFKLDNGGMTSGENGTEIVKKTAEKGSFLLKNMHPGTYRVVVKKPGYKEKVVTVSVSGGERSDLSVQLEKV
jgi:hypothetical protein